MPSPFPGMDPYLESPSVWQDFHHSFIDEMRAVLVPKVRPKYAVHIERYVCIAEPTGEETRIRPDVTVAETHKEGVEAKPQTMPTLTAVLVPLPEPEEVYHYFLEIREVATQKSSPSLRCFRLSTSDPARGVKITCAKGDLSFKAMFT
jgi:hypothetical protein